MRYDLNKAFERVGIPHEFRSRVHYHEISFLPFFNFCRGFAISPDNVFYIVSTGERVRTDFVLAHEVLGHGMDKNDYSEFDDLESGVDESIFGKKQKKEHHAEAIALEKLLELEVQNPNQGYVEYFDKCVRGIELRRKSRLHRILHPRKHHHDVVYHKFLDLGYFADKRRLLPAPI